MSDSIYSVIVVLIRLLDKASNFTTYLWLAICLSLFTLLSVCGISDSLNPAASLDGAGDLSEGILGAHLLQAKNLLYTEDL